MTFETARSSSASAPPDFTIPERLNLADWFLDARVREGRGARVALRTDRGDFTYAEVQSLAHRYGRLLRGAGVEPEQRVLLALPDGPDFVGAFFGALEIGAVVVMVNPELRPEAIAYFLRYTGAAAAVVHRDGAAAFDEAARLAGEVEAAGPVRLKATLVAGDPAFDARLAAAPAELEALPTHRDDAAIWLFSGGTTGRPKAVVQTGRSFVNTTELYAKGVLHYDENDVTMSVPKLFFGYATGCNLLFPFAAGAAAVLFPEKCTAEVVFEKIAKFRPTILVNVPTMIQHLVSHERAASQDFSSLRLATSAGEALPAELDARWRRAFGVDLLDGLGTAEMWHIFLSNAPGRAVPGSLGRVVPGFQVRACDDAGNEVARGDVGWLWVRGDSRAIAYWREMDKTRAAFRGEWYVSGDMIRQDEDGVFWYCGRGDDMLKVAGKWLSPAEVENCLLQHPAVAEAAVVGVVDANGLTKPHAFVVAKEGAGAAAGAAGRGTADAAAEARGAALAEELRAFALQRLEPYKAPRRVTVMTSFPRTHLGKIDRGKLRAES